MLEPPFFHDAVLVFFLCLLDQVYAGRSADAWFVDIVYVLGKFDEMNLVLQIFPLQTFNLISCNLNVHAKITGILMLSSWLLYFLTHKVL